MIFTAQKDGHGMQTSSPACIYDRAVLLSMQKAGYKFKIDGKSATVAQVCQMKETAIRNGGRA